jgi:hypothetical protein
MNPAVDREVRCGELMIWHKIPGDFILPGRGAGGDCAWIASGCEEDEEDPDAKSIVWFYCNQRSEVIR